MSMASWQTGWGVKALHGAGARARFDDLTEGGATLAFSHPVGILVANDVSEVVPLLQVVEEATADGLWAAGFVAYEAAAGLDPRWSTRPATEGEAFRELPLAWFGLYSEALPAPRLGSAPRAEGNYSVRSWQMELDELEYKRRVECVRHQIGAGETYQCNFTVRMRSKVAGDLESLYCDLALAQGGAHNAYLDTGRFVVASASPELFFDWTGSRLTTRPMKGTATRGRWPAEDQVRARQLLGSTKERAENAMIVDLLRNDVGRLADWGSVAVPSLFALERYETVWQLTSTVTAAVRPQTTLVDVMRALFPCGSVTGAPKQRTMELIAELEASRRGVYCGAIGLVAPAGSPFRARFNVAIRTVVVDRDSGEAVYGTGGGITWDSNASSEYEELLAKAAVLHRAPEEFQLVETMAFSSGEGLRNLDRHLGRLGQSAAYFGYPFDSAQVRSVLDAAVRDLNDPTRVRLLVDRTGATTVGLGPLPASPQAPVTLAIDWEPVSSSEVWQYHKTTRRGVYERRAARHPYADDVLMVNERTELTETTVANIVLHLDRQWCTPPLESGCLPGVGRQRLLEDGQLRERPLTIDDLRAADGIAIVSSLRGWRQAVLAPGALDQGADDWSSAGRGVGGKVAIPVDGSSHPAGDADSGT
jgi:para-aminobenzoate synthetase/4-amino-4-deoxychorismate lyase